MKKVVTEEQALFISKFSPFSEYYNLTIMLNQRNLQNKYCGMN